MSSLKIAQALDAVADSLEAKGHIKEAYEIDKVADALEDAYPKYIKVEKVPYLDWNKKLKELENKHNIKIELKSSGETDVGGTSISSDIYANGKKIGWAGPTAKETFVIVDGIKYQSFI